MPKWVRPALAIAAAILVLVVAVVFGSKYYYQVKPLTSTTPDQQQTGNTPDQGAFTQALASTKIEDQNCSYFVVNDLDGNLSQDTLKQMGVGICKLVQTKGVSTIQHPLALGLNSGYYPGDDTYNGVGVIKSDHTYFVSFSLYKNPEDQYQIALNNATILKTVNVSAITAVPVQSSVAGSQLAQVTGTDASGKASVEYFAQSLGRYSDGSFSIQIVKNSDGSFSNSVRGGYNTDPADVSFLVPYTFTLGETGGDRDSAIESQNNTNPIYHKAACGLEERYADMAFYIGYPVTIGINFGYKPTLHITTATQGYVPQEWGTILANVSFADFKTKVQSSKAYNSTSPVEMMNVGGYTVKHVGPIAPDRTCEYNQDNTYDMYQTVKNGAVVTFTVTHDDRDTQASPDIEKIMSQVLSTLSFSPR